MIPLLILGFFAFLVVVFSIIAAITKARAMVYLAVGLACYLGGMVSFLVMALLMTAG